VRAQTPLDRYGSHYTVCTRAFDARCARSTVVPAGEVPVPNDGDGVDIPGRSSVSVPHGSDHASGPAPTSEEGHTMKAVTRNRPLPANPALPEHAKQRREEFESRFADGVTAFASSCRPSS
jgi:hypothetical protein